MKTNQNYSAAVDGLRFLAFALVFMHHMPAPASLPLWSMIAAKGWLGVDLFFAISAYLLHRSLQVERAKKGDISVRKFFIRRIARIYPLMVGYALVITAFKGTGNPAEWGVFASYLLALNNFVWIAGLASGEVPWLGHLWSLSFEIQLYLCVPVLFYLSQRLSSRAYLLLLLGVVVYATLGRQVIFLLGAQHPVIYMTPLLRPESFLSGMALAALRPNWSVWLSALLCAIAVVFIGMLSQPWGNVWSSALIYPLIGIAAAGAIDLAERATAVKAVLGSTPIAFLGERSYGLYIFHLFFILTARDINGWGLEAGFPTWLCTLALILTATALAAFSSYRCIERPIYDWARKRL